MHARVDAKRDIAIDTGSSMFGASRQAQQNKRQSSRQSSRGGRSTTDGSSTSLMGDLKGKLEDPSNPIAQIGSLRFPNSNRLCKWVRVKGEKEPDENTADVQGVKKILFHPSWKLPEGGPSVIISVTGAANAQSWEMSEQLDADFRRGLQDVVRTSHAWVTTGGTSSGVMELVGSTLRHVENAVCIGIAPWRAVLGYDAMANLTDGSIHTYRHSNEPVALTSPRSADSRESAAPDGSAEDRAATPEAEPATPVTRGKVGLDHNHTHFILVDDQIPSGSSGSPFGGEIGLRSKLEEVICPDNNYLKDADGNDTAVTDDDNIEVPMVMLVVGGGVGTLKVVLGALGNDRPVVVLPDSGAAARAIFAVCIGEGESRVKLEPAEAGRRMPDMESHPERCKEAEELLDQIRTASAGYTGFNKNEAVQAYEMQQQKSLRDVILTALLDDCKNPTDAIRLAVSWRDPEITRGQLDMSKNLDQDGLKRAFELALANADTDVVRELITSSYARPEQVRIHEIIKKGTALNFRVRATISSARRSAMDFGTVYAEYKIDTLHNPDFTASVKKGAKRLGLTEVANWKKAQKTKKGDQPLFEVGEDSEFGLAILGRELDWDFGYMSNYLRFRGCKAAAKEGCTTAQERKLRCNWFDLMMIAVLAQQQQLAKLLWVKVEEPLRAALMAALICQRGASVETGAGQDELIEQANTYENWAIELLGEADHAEDVSLLLLNYPRTSAVPDGTSPVDKWIESPIETAITVGNIGCKRFLAHKYCISLLDSIYEGYKHKLSSNDGDEKYHFDIDDEECVDDAGVDKDYMDTNDSFLDKGHMELIKVPLFGQLYLPTSKVKGKKTAPEPSSKDLTQDLTARVITFARSFDAELSSAGALRHHATSARSVVSFFFIPKVKFVSHLVFSFAYYLLYLECLTGVLPWLGVGIFPSWFSDRNWMHRFGELPPAYIPPAECLMWAWTVCRAVEEWRQMYRVGRDAYEETERWSSWVTYFRSGGNLLDILNYASVLLVAALRINVRLKKEEGSESAYDLYADRGLSEDDIETLVVCRCLYAIAAISISARTSSLIKNWQGYGMLYTITYSMIGGMGWWMLLVFFFSFGTGVALTILMPAQNSLEYMRPFWRPFWGLLGESFTDEAENYFEHTKQASADHFFIDWRGMPSVLVPVLGFLYLFFTTVVLVNLLIAQMSARYESVVAEGYEKWLAERVALIKEFQDERDPLPPPLNVFWGFYEMLCALKREFLTRTRPDDVDVQRRALPGFKLVVGGRAAEHARSTASELRRRYLKAEVDREQATMEAHKGHLKEHGEALSELLSSQFARLNDRISDQNLLIGSLQTKLDKMGAR